MWAAEVGSKLASSCSCGTKRPPASAETTVYNKWSCTPALRLIALYCYTSIGCVWNMHDIPLPRAWRLDFLGDYCKRTILKQPPAVAVGFLEDHCKRTISKAPPAVAVGFFGEWLQKINFEPFVFFKIFNVNNGH